MQRLHHPANAATETATRRLAHGFVTLALALVLASCSSLEFQRDTETSGTFKSSAWAFTIFSIDLPGPALTIARGNASDARRQNMLVTRETVIPSLGWFDWVFDIIGIRYAKVSGTWGFEPE